MNPVLNFNPQPFNTLAAVAQPNPAVAVYWDIENLHAALLDDAHGQGTFASTRFRPQEELIDIPAVMAYAAGFGPAVVNRAYANWSTFHRYKHATLNAAMDLVQVFGPGASAKNGADIRLCLDLMDDLARLPHISTFVVVAGDSDYIPLANRLKATGRRLVAVGPRNATNPYWAKACHEFRYYDTLVRKPAAVVAAPAVIAPAATPEAAAPGVAQPAIMKPRVVAASAAPARPQPRPQAVPPAARLASAPDKPLPVAVSPLRAVATMPQAAHSATAQVTTPESPKALPEAMPQPAPQPRPAAVQSAHELVFEALNRLSRQQAGRPWVQKSALRACIARHLAPGFDEAVYGYASFGDLLASMGSRLCRRHGAHGPEVSLRRRSECAWLMQEAA